MKNILVPIDLSEITDAVIEQARCFAGTQASHLWLLHVAPPAPEVAPFNVDRNLLRKEAAKRLRDQRRALRDIAERLREDRIHVSARFVCGTVNTTILSEASRIHAELIIIGSHNHGSVFHAIFGGIGQKVSRNAPCPVMTVPLRRRKAVWQPLAEQSGTEQQARRHIR